MSYIAIGLPEADPNRYIYNAAALMGPAGRIAAGVVNWRRLSGKSLGRPGTLPVLVVQTEFGGWPGGLCRYLFLQTGASAALRSPVLLVPAVWPRAS